MECCHMMNAILVKNNKFAPPACCWICLDHSNAYSYSFLGSTQWLITKFLPPLTCVYVRCNHVNSIFTHTWSRVHVFVYTCAADANTKNLIDTTTHAFLCCYHVGLYWSQHRSEYCCPPNGSWCMVSSSTELTYVFYQDPIQHIHSDISHAPSRALFCVQNGFKHNLIATEQSMCGQRSSPTTTNQFYNTHACACATHGLQCETGFRNQLYSVWLQCLRGYLCSGKRGKHGTLL